MCGSKIHRCRHYFVHHFVRRCSSVTFVWLFFVISAAPIFFSDPDPLVFKAYTPAYVQSQIDLLKRQKKFTTKLVLEKPKLPPKSQRVILQKDSLQILKEVLHRIFSRDTLILNLSKALLQYHQQILLLKQKLFLHPVTTQGPEILNQSRSGRLVVVLVLSFLQSTKSKGPTEEMPQDTP